MTEVERLQQIVSQRSEPLQEIELNNLKNKIPEVERQNKILNDQLNRALQEVEEWKRKAMAHERSRSYDHNLGGSAPEEKEARSGVVS